MAGTNDFPSGKESSWVSLTPTENMNAKSSNQDQIFLVSVSYNCSKNQTVIIKNLSDLSYQFTK